MGNTQPQGDGSRPAARSRAITDSGVLAAIVDSPGAEPRLGTVVLPPRTPGTTLVAVVAAPLNPLDLVIASGTFHSARHDAPYVPGSECVGTVLASDSRPPGSWVYAECHAAPDTPGALAAQVLVADENLLPLPDGLDPVQAAAVGNSGTAAYMPLVEEAGLRPGDTVLVLGATGAVGQLAVQVARRCGAGRVVGVARHRAALEGLLALGADAVLELRADEGADELAARLQAVSGTVDVVLDGVYGTPLEAALRVCAPRARVVNIGNPAGATARVPAGLLRGKQLTLSGFAGLHTPLRDKQAALTWLWTALAQGELRIDTRTFPLKNLLPAWRTQAASPHAKCVVLPQDARHPDPTGAHDRDPPASRNRRRVGHRPLGSRSWRPRCGKAGRVMARPEPQHTASLRPTVDCLVVGGGPVGLLTAVFLGQAGLQVSVVERWPQRYPLPRACTIDHEALRILQAAGLMDSHADLFEPSQGERGGYEFRNGEGELLQAIDWNRAAESGWANTNGFHQPDLEAALEDLALATPGVTVHRGWTFQSLTQDPEGVTVQLAPTKDLSEAVQVRSRWLIGADGANSHVRSHLGIGEGDSGFQADWLVVDYAPLVEEKWSAFVTQYCDPAQPATAVNSGPGRRRFEFMRRADVTAEELGRESTAWRLMAPWGVTPETARLERHAVYTFRGRWAHAWRRENVFLAGDAAHLMPPFLGQGLCSGLRDARALTWRLGLVHRGLATPAVLDTYGPERTGHVREIIDEAVAAGRVICELDVGRAAARDTEMKKRSLDPDATTREPPHPRLGEPSLTVTSHGAAGRLAPQGRVRAADRVGLFDDVVGGGWQLISRAGDPALLLGDEDMAWFTQIGGVVADVSGDGPVQDLDGAYERWLTEHRCEALLARPDFYVFAAGGHTGIPRFIACLRRALRSGHGPYPRRTKEDAT